jgi:hypothetical protein
VVGVTKNAESRAEAMFATTSLYGRVIEKVLAESFFGEAFDGRLRSLAARPHWSSGRPRMSMTYSAPTLRSHRGSENRVQLAAWAQTLKILNEDYHLFS